MLGPNVTGTAATVPLTVGTPLVCTSKLGCARPAKITGVLATVRESAIQPDVGVKGFHSKSKAYQAGDRSVMWQGTE